MNYYSSPQESQQFELFSSEEDKNSGGKKSPLSRKVEVPLEQLIIVAIGVVVLAVIVYSLGIERGKQSAVEKMGGAEINLADSTNDVIITPSSEPVTQVNQGSMPVTPAAVTTRPLVQAPRDNQDIVVKVPVPVEPDTDDLAAPAGVYTVQVASFKQRKFADQEVIALKKKGQDAFTLAKGDFFLVCIGHHKSKDQADKSSRSLKSKYKDNIVRRL